MHLRGKCFEYGGQPVIDVDYDVDSGTYGLTTKKLQMFKELFKYDKPNELWKECFNAFR